MGRPQANMITIPGSHFVPARYFFSNRFALVRNQETLLKGRTTLRTKFRIPKRVWTVVNLLLLTWIAWIAAGIVGIQAKETLTSIKPSPVKKVDTVLATASETSVKDFSRIVNRNIFNSSAVTTDLTTTPLIEDVSATDDNLADAPVSSIKAKLLGTLLEPDGNVKLAAIELEEAKEQGVYKENDRFLDALIVRISRNRVYISRSGRMEVMRVDFSEWTAKQGPGGPPGAKGKGAAPTPGSGPDVSQLGEGEYAVSRRYIDSQLANMSKLITEVRAVPNIQKDGSADGFRLFAIKKDSLFSKIGFQNKDVVKRINGVKLDSAEKGLELFQALRHESSFDIDIERNSQKASMRFSVQ